MSKRFVSARAKLARAEEHRVTLAPDVKAFVEAGPIGLRSTHNLRGTEPLIRCSYRITSIKPPPEKWSLIVGDAIQNLRAALDHAVWAIVVRHKGTAFAQANHRKIQFPILDTPSSSLTKKLTEIGLPDDVIAAIENAQPYRRNTEAPRDDPLWLIRTLSNTDKHRLLHVIAMYPEQGQVVTTPPLEDGESEWVAKGALKAGTEVLRFTGVRPAIGSVEVKCQLSVGVSIAETTESRAIAVDLGLRVMRDRTSEILDELDPPSVRQQRRRSR